MTDQSALEKKLLDNLQQHFHQLATEAKKKHPPLKEAAEAGIVKIRAASIRKHDLHGTLLAESGEILEPFFMGCDTKNPKMVQISLIGIQKLITFEAVSKTASNNLINCLWNLMESGIEEVRLLQTITLLISTNQIVQGDGLAKALSLCFRLHFTKNSTTNNTASATIRQLVSIIFERVQIEDRNNLSPQEAQIELKLEELKPGKVAPKSLRQSAADAFLFFQDLIQLVNADQPFWLTGLTEMTRTFGLELIELIFTSFPETFHNHPEFSFILKERVCQLIIKLLSPNIKQRPGASLVSTLSSLQSTGSIQSSDKPFWPITVRLMRIVAVLIKNFYAMLITESEIFFSLLVKSLESDKPNWQRSIALEAIYKMVQPNLISCLCRFYDMKPQSSKIFRDIVNALCIYIQSQFLYIDSSSSQSLIASIVNNSTQNPIANQSSASNITPQPAFMLRGVWIPLLFNISKGNYKPYFIEQLDKLDPPSNQDGHGLTSAFACLLEVVNCITILIDNNQTQTGGETTVDTKDFIQQKIDINNLDEETRSLNENLLTASWCGLLGSFSLLLDASTDETITDLILKTMQKLAGLYGAYNLTIARDAVLTSICKSSLPPLYSLPILSMSTENTAPQDTAKHSRQTSLDASSNFNLANLLAQQNSQPTNTNAYLVTNDSNDTKQQVVAVGTPLPSSNQNSQQQGPVMLTSKNLQCMNALLNIANQYGYTLEEKSWQILLTTLQHLVWILGLKPTTGGTLKVGRAGTEAGASTNALITTAAMSDLPVLSAMLSRLFESSQNLSDESLTHLMNALIKLSQESMTIAMNNREPSLFAVAKLLETGIVNLKRIEIIWKPITTHLIDVCQHPQVKMREWGVEALCSLVKSALSQSQSEKSQTENNSEPNAGNSILTVQQFMILASLQDLSYNPHSDIRQKQLDCTLQILQSTGDQLTHGWPQIFEIVGSINESQNENLIRSSFQCLQLIISDFLTSIPSLCLILCIDTTAKFASQTQELNVSLTAIGLLWNIADYLYSNQDKIRVVLNDNRNLNGSVNNQNSNVAQLCAFDCLWMGLFTRLGDLCTDSRASVRKSAGQTLFSTLGTHVSILETRTWHSVLWTVLFPLLDRVKTLSGSASNDKITDSKLMGSGASGNILLHHSRNTAQKQWSETQVLVLSGVSRIFHMKKDLLVTIEDFFKAWILLFDYIKISALSKNSEVSLSALKCFQDLLTSSKMNNFPNKQNEIESLWEAAWNVWVEIGLSTTDINEEIINEEANKTIETYIPSQAFLSSLIQMFPYLFIHIESKFTESDFIKLSSVLLKVLSTPISSSDVSSAYILSTSFNDPLTPLQENVLALMDSLQKEILHDEQLHFLLPSVFSLLLAFSCFAVNVVPFQLPFFDNIKNLYHNRQTLYNSNGVNPNIFYTFGEKSLKNVLSLYQQTANTSIVIQSNVLNLIIKTLKIPLSLKYACPSQYTWKLAVNLLLNILQIGLPITRQHPSNFITIWGELALSFEGFLFPTSKPPANQTLEEQQFDESLDVKVVELIRDQIMPFAAKIPKEFLLQTVSLLNKGSIHSATNSSPVDTESTRKLREEFARTCFETLLQFSFLGPTGNPGLFIQSTISSDFPPDHNIGIVNKLAVTSLLQRFNEVVLKFVEDEKICPCPLPRHRMAEISFVLKALATLISSLKKAPLESVEPDVWQLLIGLYPYLIECISSSSVQVTKSLKEVLHQYADLLSPPTKDSLKSVPNGS